MLNYGWEIKEYSEENGMHSLMIYVDGQLVDKIVSGSLRWLSSIADDRYATAYRNAPQATEAAKDIEVQETVQQAMELDVTPLGDLCPKCEWPTGICICTKQVHNAAKELGEYVQKWSQEHGLRVHILNHK